MRLIPRSAAIRRHLRYSLKLPFRQTKQLIKVKDSNNRYSVLYTRLSAVKLWYYSIATHNSAKNVVARTMFTNTHVKAAWDLLVNCFRRKEFSTTGLSLLTTLLCILPAFTLVVCDSRHQTRNGDRS